MAPQRLKQIPSVLSFGYQIWIFFHLCLEALTTNQGHNCYFGLADTGSLLVQFSCALTAIRFKPWHQIQISQTKRTGFTTFFWLWKIFLLPGANPSTASQAFIKSCLTARVRPLWRHIHDYMARTYHAPFISICMAGAYRASFISTYITRAYRESVISTTPHTLE